MRRILFLLAIQLPLTAPAQRNPAQRNPGPLDRPIPCSLPCPTCEVRVPCVSGPRVERTSSRAVLTLDGRVVRYEITERFVNRGSVVAETEYLLPLPARAAFEDLALSIDGEMVTGETLRAERARAIYEEIVRRQRDPALVEWMGQGLLRARIFPIAPGEEKTIVVRFRAIAEREGDALRIDYRPPMRGSEGAVRSTFELRYPAHGEFGRAFSPTHDLHPEQSGSLRAVRADAVRSVVSVFVPVRTGTSASVHVLTHAVEGEDGFAMITVAPPPATRGTTPRDVTFILDVSGSMRGTKLEQAKAAGRALLASLNVSDRFRVIAFSTDVRDFREGWSAATPANVRSAQQYLRELAAEGSTNISGALEEALRASLATDRLPLVLFLTDGTPTVGERRPDRIAELAERLRGRRRLFTFGVGIDVNASLLEMLALSGRGTAQFVRPDEDVERAVEVVVQRLRQPVATDLRVRVNGVRVDRVQPAGDLDLFAGQELTVFARYRGARRGATVTVEGESADGPVRWTTTADFSGRADENSFVARLWAVQRVGWLSAERRRNGATAELDDELRLLGTRFGIPTELTSYLVVEPGMQGSLRDVRLNAVRPAPPNLNLALTGVTVTGIASAPQSRADAAGATFEAAKMAAEQRSVTTMAQMDRTQRQQGGQQQFVLGRVFTQQGDAWQDALTPAVPTRVVTIRAYSEAYFALLVKLPVVKDAFALGEKVSVQGRAVRLVLDPTGEASLSAGALDSIVRDW
ncbi:MAG: VIT domain-containing protein [Gemmatimonadota bacterium]